MKLQKLFLSLEDDINKLNDNLQKIIGAKNPILYAAAEHLFTTGGKKIRPCIILIIAKITDKHKSIQAEQYRLAEITEIIHTASLVHDDIIDDCDTRRGINTVHNKFNTKIAVLAGDFLFAKSSWYIANLNNLEVVKIISKVIIDFAEGEIRQGLTNFDAFITIEDYIEKSFYKTATLIACSCKATAILSKCDETTQNDFYLYGKHLGLAFQIIDDILDITSKKNELGKPSYSDLKNGNLTAPLIFAIEENKQLYKFIEQESSNEEEIEHIIDMVKNTNGIEKAKDLAEEHIQVAIQIIQSKFKCQNAKLLILLGDYILDRFN